jgi:hypothetical protein
MSNTTLNYPVTGAYIFERNALMSGNEPLVFHCHHYNCFLQYAIESTRTYIDVDSILTESAQEVVFSHFVGVFEAQPHLSRAEKIALIHESHRQNGFGLIDLTTVDSTGGGVLSEHNHYAKSWLVKFGKRRDDESGVAFFTTGYIAGALDALDNTLGKHSVLQTHCLTKGDPCCEFKVSVNEQPKKLTASAGEGVYQANIDLKNHSNSPVDYVAIREAVVGMGIEGDEHGVISTFGVLLTRMYANYYTLISYRFMAKLCEVIGAEGKVLAEELLVEAGHVCAFNTFGGIMESAEWYGLVHPSLKTREDWVHGIVAVVNALGWGHYQLVELEASKKLVLRLYSGYESNMFEATQGTSKDPIAYLSTGITAGIMNLIYHGDITTKPELNETYYDKIFKSEGRFVAKQTKSRAMGDAYDEFEASR